VTAADTSDLPAPIIEWLETALEGRVVRRERSVSRREGWWVDVSRAEGADRQGFLRLERFKDGKLKQPSCQVGLETQVVAALHGRGVAVPAIYAHSEALQATLFERVPGRDDVHELEDPAQQSAVARDFMEQLARLHELSVGELDLPGLSVPVAAEEFALAGIAELEQSYAASVEVPDPLAMLTFAWLRRSVPSAPERPVLVQGDTGPGNFVYVEDRVSAILDWECAHFGDPMEDLGHLYSRAFFHPWGDMSALLDAYTAAGGVPLDRAKLHFYRVASFAKAALGSTVAVNYFRPEGPLPMMIFFSVAGERGLAESLAAALGAEGAKAALPEPAAGLSRSLTLPVEAITERIVEHELLPKLDSAYLQDRARQVSRVAAYQARRERHLGAVVAQELSELEVLVRGPVSTVEEGLVQLNAQIEAWDGARIGEIARYLCRRAQRAEALALPLAGRYARLALAAI